jgi:hypothetical protein
MVTMQMFQKYGISAYFTGCLTLFFDPVEEKGDKVYAVDVNTCPYIPHVDVSLDEYPNAIKVEHDLPKSEDYRNIQMRMAMTQALLENYSKAALVITTRLHCALPCRAFGTKVKFVHSNLSDYRFSGLLDILAGSGSLEDAQETIPRSRITAITDFFEKFEML